MSGTAGSWKRARKFDGDIFTLELRMEKGNISSEYAAFSQLCDQIIYLNFRLKFSYQGDKNKAVDV